MQIKNRDDLRYFLTIKRSRILGVAEKILEVNDTTVSPMMSHTSQSRLHRIKAVANWLNGPFSNQFQVSNFN